MLGFSSGEHEGALLRRLKEAGQRGQPSRLGFSTGTDGARRRALVIVGRVAGGADSSAERDTLLETGAEAVEFVARVGSGTPVGAASTTEHPCGIFLPAGPGQDGGTAKTDGLDWIHLASGAVARPLAAGSLTRLIDVPVDMAPGRLSGLAGVKAEVLVVCGQYDDRPFTLDTLLALTAIQSASQRPVLAGPGLGLSPADAAVLREHGVEGVLVTSGPEDVAAWARAVDAL